MNLLNYEAFENNHHLYASNSLQFFNQSLWESALGPFTLPSLGSLPIFFPQKYFFYICFKTLQASRGNTAVEPSSMEPFWWDNNQWSFLHSVFSLSSLYRDDLVEVTSFPVSSTILVWTGTLGSVAHIGGGIQCVSGTQALCFGASLDLLWPWVCWWPFLPNSWSIMEDTDVCQQVWTVFR